MAICFVTFVMDLGDQVLYSHARKQRHAERWLLLQGWQIRVRVYM